MPPNPNRHYAIVVAYALWARGGYEELYDLVHDPHETVNLVSSQPEVAQRMRATALAWEQTHGLSDSLSGGAWGTYPCAPPTTEVPRLVHLNDVTWPINLPDDERDSVESYAEAFTRAIAKESSLSPDKLSLGQYLRKGRTSLVGTPWEGVS